MPGRRSFRAPDDLPSTNTYVVELGGLALRDHLAVRDALRRDARLRRAYGELKRRLAAEVVDAESYVAGKTDFVLWVLEAAGFTNTELAEVAAANRRD